MTETIIQNNIIEEYNFSVTYENINSFATSCGDGGTQDSPSSCSASTTDITTNAGLDVSDDSRVLTDMGVGEWGWQEYEICLSETEDFIVTINSLNWTWEGRSGTSGQLVDIYYYNYTANGYNDSGLNMQGTTDVFK